MQLYFRFVKRPGESHLALDGKKHTLFQGRFKDVQVGSRWFSTLYILAPNFHTKRSSLPVRLHFVISRLLAGGSLGFRIVLLLIPGSQISVWHSCGLSVFVVCFTSAIPIPW